MILTSFWWRGCEPRRTAQGTKRNGAAGNHITHVRRDQSPMGRMGRGRKRVATLLLTCYIQLEWCVRMWSDERGGKYVIVFLLFRSRGVSRKEVDRLRANSSVAERSAPRNAVDRMRANLRTYVGTLALIYAYAVMLELLERGRHSGLESPSTYVLGDPLATFHTDHRTSQITVHTYVCGTAGKSSTFVDVDSQQCSSPATPGG